MIYPTPQTIGNSIQEKIHGLFDSITTYLPKDGMKITQLCRDLEKLGKVDAKNQSLLLVSLHTLCGDREQAEYYLRNSKKIHVAQVDIALAELTMLINLGYFSESIPVLRALVYPTSGSLTKFLSSPPGNGAFHILNSILDMAKTMNLANVAESSGAFATVVRIMDQWGDTDEDYSRVLDIAGAMLREKNLIYQDGMVTVPVETPPDGGFGYVKLSYRIAVDFDTAIDMTCKYAERLASSHLKIPQSMMFEFEATA
jgi:hypothetical protein